jgi:hypothetical protein
MIEREHADGHSGYAPMSALPPKADMIECEGHVCFVPKADIATTLFK